MTPKKTLATLLILSTLIGSHEVYADYSDCSCSSQAALDCTSRDSSMPCAITSSGVCVQGCS